jgi:preprotein translocase subunit SecE
MFAKTRNFVSEVAAELRKVSWLTRKDLIDSAKIVLISVFILGIYLAVVDLVLARGLSLIIR